MENTSTPKVFFLQVGIIATLYTSVVSFLMFLFEVIDRLFPQDGVYLDIYNSTLRISISTLIVAFPIFIWLSRIHRKQMSLEETPSKIRKWLLFLTLFISGLAMAVDLVVVINSFLGGETLTAGFLLKVLAILVVAGSIFFFYLKDIRGDWNDKQKQVKAIATVVSFIVFVSIVSSFFVIGSPESQRKYAHDNTRVNDLMSIQWQIVNYYQSKGVLPEKTIDLNDSISGFIAPTDPVSKAEYVYKKTGALTFELCAMFEMESQNTNNNSYPVSYEGGKDENWNHIAGDKCFVRTIDPDRYPVTPKPVRY